VSAVPGTRAPQVELDTHRKHLLAGVPVTERRLDIAGIPTAVLEGGDGPPVVLLHGPGESAVNWRWTIPDIVTTHRVIAPDLPAHGSSGTGEAPLDAEVAVAWLDGGRLDRLRRLQPGPGPLRADEGGRPVVPQGRPAPHPAG
jgi:pimeloyl-ACP methyl ester carboxylesterase